MAKILERIINEKFEDDDGYLYHHLFNHLTHKTTWSANYQGNYVALFFKNKNYSQWLKISRHNSGIIREVECEYPDIEKQYQKKRDEKIDHILSSR